MDPSLKWMEEKLKGMELIVNEKFEGIDHPELGDFLTESCGPPTDQSSLVSLSSSSPSSFASSFNESISEPQVDNEGKCELTNSPRHPPVPADTCSKEQTNSVDFSEQKLDIERVVDTQVKVSKLPTPSMKLTNCSTLTRSPVGDTQLEYLKELATAVSTPCTRNSFSDDKSQPSSGRSSSNDTYVISHSSSEERVPENLSESVTSESSSVNSSLSVDSVTGAKKLKVPRVGSHIPTKPTVRTKIAKPSTKPSLLPSKVMEKPSKTSFRQPLCKSNGAKKIAKPTTTLSKNSRLNPTTTLSKNSRLNLKHQENGGVAAVSSIVAQKPARKVLSNKTRSRKSSIPKPVAVSKLRESQSTKDSLAELETTCTLKPAMDPVIQSTPISSKTGPKTESTPNRRRLIPTETPTRNEEFDNDLRPSFSLSSIEGSEPTKTSCPSPQGRTPKTVTKRRSLLPTAGGKELAVAPLNIGTPCKKARDVSQTQQRSSSSPHLEGDKQTMPPPKKSLKPRMIGHGLQNGPSQRLAFRPRNGPVPKVKREGPLKPNALLYGEDAEMIPKIGGSKVVHSPINKENVPGTPHSEWSPIRKKQHYNEEDAYYRCTKRITAAK